MSDNRREFYRVRLYGHPMTVVLTGEREYRGSIEDLSGNGMGFESEDELAFLEAEVVFELEEKEYRWPIHWIRKTPSHSKRFLYAVRFGERDSGERKAMYEALMRVDLRQRFGRKDQ